MTAKYYCRSTVQYSKCNVLKKIFMVLFLFSTVLQFLQCPACWTGLQLVVSPGPNRLPAVVHLKYSVSGSKVEDDEFYGLDIVDKFDDEAMAKHVYNDPVQLAVRIILCR